MCGSWPARRRPGAAGVITADELGIQAGGAVTLDQAANDANTLAVATNGAVAFNDPDDLIIGTVTAGGCGFTGARASPPAAAP